MDWYYDGQSWVYADKQPEKKGPSIEQVKTAEKVNIFGLMNSLDTNLRLRICAVLR